MRATTFVPAVCVILITFLASPSAMAMQDPEDVPSFRDASKLSVRITPSIWVARMKGDVSFDGAETLQMNDELSGLRDQLSPTFNGDAEFRYRRWRLRTSIFDFSADGSNSAPRTFTFGDLTVPAGTRVESRFDQVMIGLEVGYSLRAIDLDELILSVSPTIGVMYVDVDLAVAAPLIAGSPSDSASLTTVLLHAGAQLKIAWRDQVIVTARAGFGSSLAGGFFTTVDVGAIWYPGGGHFGVTGGYRLMFLDSMEGDDDVEFESRLAGLYLGGSLRF